MIIVYMACGKLPSQDNKISKERRKDINISGISNLRTSKHYDDNVRVMFSRTRLKECRCRAS